MSIDNFPQRVAGQLALARRKHGPIHSAHEAYAVLAEELDEFWDAVKKGSPYLHHMEIELLHIAAMAQRAAEDLGLFERVAEEAP